MSDFTGSEQFGMPYLFLKEYFICFQYVFVDNISWFEMHDSADDLQCGAHAEHGNDCADAHRAAEKPADEKGDAHHDRLYHADGRFREAFTQSDQQGIARATALCCTHIEILPVAHDEQTNDNHDAADGDVVEIRQGDDVVDEVHIVAHQQGIQNRAIADFFLQHYINTQNDDADNGMHDTITHSYPIGCAHGKAVPRGQTDVCLNGQIDTDGEDEQAEGRFQDFFYHLYFCLHGISPYIKHQQGVIFLQKRKGFCLFLLFSLF